MAKKKSKLELTPAQQAAIADAFTRAIGETREAYAEFEDMTPEEWRALKADAARAVKAVEGSTRGAAALKERTVIRGSAVIEALRKLDREFPGEFWDGETFLVMEACCRLEKDLPPELVEALDAVDDEGRRQPERNARNFASWIRRAKPNWVRNSSPVEEELPPDADARDRYQAERRKRAAKVRQQMKEAEVELKRTT